MKKATTEDEETTTISSSNGWWCNPNYFQLCQETSWYNEIWNSSIKYELNCQWDRVNIDDRYSVCIMVNTCQKIEQRTINVSWNVEHSFFCWILLIWPSLLAALHFGIASLQYPRHLSAGCMLLYGTWRYIDKENL